MAQRLEVTAERLLGGMFVRVGEVKHRDGKCRLECRPTSNPSSAPVTVITTKETAQELGLV